MMFCQKEEIDHVLGNHKGALNTWCQLNRSSFSAFQRKITYFLAKKLPSLVF